MVISKRVKYKIMIVLYFILSSVSLGVGFSFLVNSRYILSIVSLLFSLYFFYLKESGAFILLNMSELLLLEELIEYIKKTKINKKKIFKSKELKFFLKNNSPEKVISFIKNNKVFTTRKNNYN